MSKPAPRVDPLIAALIGRLPPAGEAWGADDRATWLGMMEMALGVVYGGAAGGGMTDLSIPKSSSDPAPPAAPPQAAKPAWAGHDYYIDKDGFVRRDPGGGRVAADDVPAEEMIYDCRTGPARDRDTIVWADGATGARPGMAFCGPG